MNRSTGIWRKDWFWALGIVLLVLIVHKTTGLTEGLERRFYDETSTQIARKPASNVAIIAIDDTSIANIGLPALAAAFAAPFAEVQSVVVAYLAALTVAVVLREVLTPHGPKGTETVFRLPLIFLAGGVVYLYREKVTLSLPLLAVALAALVPLSFTPLYKAALYLVTAWGILVLALAPALTRRAAEPPADLSYGVYLYGWPIQQALHALFPALGAVALLWPSLAVTVVVAALSWYLIEKPALGLKRRLMGAS